MSRAFATIATKSYLAHVRALHASICEFHDYPLYVAFADDIEGFVDPAQEKFITLRLEDYFDDANAAMTFYYTPFELCTALRPFLHAFLLKHTDVDTWIFLDSDIQVLAPLDDVFARLDKVPILLSPHLLRPVPAALKDYETHILRYGIYNGGFLGLKRCFTTEQFLDWFRDRLITHCFNDEGHLFVDQLWLNFVPLFFRDSETIAHEGANVAYWNLHERRLQRCASDRTRYRANGQPLLFVHFSCWSEERPDDWSYGRPVSDPEQASLMAEIGRAYAKRLAACGLETCRAWPYSFATFHDGSPITLRMRRVYYEAVAKGEMPPGSPFALSDWFRPNSGLAQRAKRFAQRMSWRIREAADRSRSNMSRGCL